MIEFRSLKPEEFEQWLEHVTFVFTKASMNPEMRTYFIAHFQNDPWKDFKNILVAVEDGVILSTMKIVVRELYVEGELIKFGGIAEVSTKPEHGGKGYSGTLLKLAIKIMEDRAYHVSMLSAGIPLYYNNYGWNKVITSMKTVKVDYDAKSTLTFRKVDFSTDMQSVIAIWGKYRTRFNGIVNRNMEYWDKWYTAEGANTYVSLTPEGLCVAYICINKYDDETVSVKEFGCADGYDDTFEAISAEAIRAFDGETRITTMIKLPSLIITNPENLIDSYADEHMMARMMIPFKLSNRVINNSDDVVSLLQGDSFIQSKYVHWDIDGF